MNIIGKLNKQIDKENSLLCVGLDSAVEKLPAHLQKKKYPQFAFNKEIIDATAEYACAYKPNSAFYEARGEAGMRELQMTYEYMQKTYPDIVTILDAKRADIGNTNEGYVKYIFDYLGSDAVTLHPYLGQEALQPFLNRKDKASIILCKTSNTGSGEFQDLAVNDMFLYEYVAEQVAKKWNMNNNCMLVVGATYPEALKKVRTLVGDMPLLIPGIGTQGGDVKKTVRAGIDSKGRGIIINVGRSIIFASGGKDFAHRAGEEAKKVRDEINKYRN